MKPLCNDTRCTHYSAQANEPCDDCRAKQERENAPLYVDKHEGEKHGGRARKFRKGKGK